MKVSVIVPVYNAQRFLSEMLESLLLQTYQNFEIICVNDGSTDESQKILDSFVMRDERIKIFTQANGGVSSARNLGIENSTGDVITFMDSDDVVVPNWIETAINLMNEYKVDLVRLNYSAWNGAPPPPHSPLLKWKI